VKLAVVTPRYGADIGGGAETAARELSTRLARDTSWDVEVLTTCARDAVSWANEDPAGTTMVDGVTVHRFPTTRTRPGDFDATSARIVHQRPRPPIEEQRAWIEAQGPYAPALIDAIRASDADVVAFHPYLYHPTVAGVRAVAERAVMHPAAHDEAAIRLPIFREVFGAAAAFVYWTDTERRFAERLFKVAARPQLVLGLGAQPGPGAAEAARARCGLGDRPFLLCFGRVDDGKGARVLTECVAEFKKRRPGPLALVFAGTVVDTPAPHPDIVVTGPVDDDTKWGLMRGATVLVTPSAYASFSIVLLEGWSVGTPAMVNGLCAVTRDHVDRSGGGLAFTSYATFEVALDNLLASAALREEMGVLGRAYVDAHYQWPALIARYSDFLGHIVARTS
jgi:glycosyltransferase involved in cell wall biosynthesis